MTTVYGWRERVLPAAPALAPRGLWSGYSVDATLATLHGIPAKRDREREGERVPEERIIRSPFAPPHLVSLFATSFPRPLVCIYIYIYTYSVYSIIVATLILRENENMRSVIGLFMETKEGRVLSHSLSRGRFLSRRKAAKRARRICKEFGRVGKFPSPSPYFLNAKLCFIVRYLLARERWGNNLDPRNQKLPFPEFSASTFRPN